MKVRSIIFWCHLLVGLTIGSVIFVMAATGAVLSFAPQLQEVSEKNIRTVVPGQAKLTYNEMIGKASTVSKTPASALAIDVDPSICAEITFGKSKMLFLNPYTGEILGEPSGVRYFMRVVEDLHRRLALGAKGMTVTKACNVAFLFMIISGFYLWWPRNWRPGALKASLVLNSTLKGKARDWNWHTVTGFWMLPLLLATSLTGLIMSYGWTNNAFMKLVGNTPAAQQIQKTSSAEKGGPIKALSPIFDWDLYLAKAQAKAPTWKRMTLRTPAKPGAPVSIFIQTEEGPEFARSQMQLQPGTGEVMKWEPFSGLSKARQARAWVHYIHTGEAWGLPSQIVAFLSACSALFLVYTGFSMAWLRFFRKKPAASTVH